MKILIFIILFLNTFFLCACDFIGESIKKIIDNPGKKPLNIVCFIDFSKSIPETTLEWYRKTVRDNLINSMHNTDKIIILPIDYGSSASSSEIFSCNFGIQKYEKPFTPLGQKEKSERDLFNSVRDSAAVKFDNNFKSASIERQKYSGGTDILGAIGLASKYIDTTYHNLIVVLSDMVQETESLNLKKEYTAKKEAASLFSKLPQVSLPAADLFILTGEQPDITLKEFQFYKAFWEGYFSNNNIKLIDYNSGSVSLMQNKIQSYSR